MEENQPVQQPTQPTPETPAGGGKSKTGMWLVILLVVIVVAVVIWLVV